MKLIIFLLSILAIKVNFVNPVTIPVPTLVTSPTPSPTIYQIPNYLIDIEVPFTVQAPLNQWKDDRYQDACEEASVLMAINWVKNLSINKNDANTSIANMSSWQKEHYGEYRDTSAFDTYNRLFMQYLQYKNVSYVENITLEQLIQALYDGKLIISPMNGQQLNNPYFTQPGPERHMVLIRGYDPIKKEFITNDPGIGKGEGYRYPDTVFYNAIRDYPTGYHVPIDDYDKNVIIISKSSDY